MNYSIVPDIKAVCSLLELTPSALAEQLGVARSTISRILKGETVPESLFLQRFYSFAYDNPVRRIDLNQLKVQFASDAHPLLYFHGARNAIEGKIDLSHSRTELDMGPGFYLGESYEQAASYVFAYPSSSLYLFDGSNLNGLKTVEYGVDLEWMLLVCYFRRRIDAYAQSPLLKGYLEKAEKADVIIAPIADNNMFETMNQFARGDITDLQAISALSASSLGKQIVLKTEQACAKIEAVDRLYLCPAERKDIEEARKASASTARDKAKLAIEKYRREGRYIEELLK